MEFALELAEVRAAFARARASRFRDTPGERDLHVLKAFRAKFGMDFVEWRQKAAEIEYDTTPEGGFIMRDKAEEKPAKASKPKKRRKKAKKATAKRAVKAPEIPVPAGDVSVGPLSMATA